MLYQDGIEFDEQVKKDMESMNKPKDKRDQDNPSTLPGWPGYRTRDGRSGYDPIDTRTEAAHTTGAFIRGLFSGKLRIKNPVSLFLLGILGLVLITPLILVIFELSNGNIFSMNEGITFLIAGIIGFAILFNVTKNLIKTLYN